MNLFGEIVLKEKTGFFIKTFPFFFNFLKKKFQKLNICHLGTLGYI